MNIIPKLVSWLVRIQPMYILMAAAILTFLLRGVIAPNMLEPVIRKFLKYGLLLMLAGLVLGSVSAEYFYGDDLYRKILSESRATSLRIPIYDKYFYQTQISKIGLARKLSGYVYAFLKMNFVMTIGVGVGFFVIPSIIDKLGLGK